MLDLPTPDFADSSLLTGGLEIRILDSGPAGSPDHPTFVLVHGLGVSSLYYRELADELAPHGRVIAVDLPGFGATDKPERALRMSGYAKVVAEAVEHLGLDGDVTLIGHSMGCQVVVETLAREPGVASSAVLIGPVVNAAERRLRTLLWRFTQSVARETPYSVLPSLLAWIRSGPRMLIDSIPPMMDYPLEDHIGDVHAPLLLVAGAKDRMAPRYWLEQLRDRAGGPARVEVVDDASHQVMVTRPDRITELALELTRGAGE